MPRVDIAWTVKSNDDQNLKIKSQMNSGKMNEHLKKKNWSM